MRLGGRWYVNFFRNVGAMVLVGGRLGFTVALSLWQDVQRELPARTLDPAARLGRATPELRVDGPLRRRYRSGRCGSLGAGLSAEARQRHRFSFQAVIGGARAAAGLTNSRVPCVRRER